MTGGPGPDTQKNSFMYIDDTKAYVVMKDGLYI